MTAINPNSQPQILREIVLWCNGGHRQDAIWAAAYTSTDFLCVWGARGTKYNDRGTKYGLATGSARSEFDKKLEDKLFKGYKIVSFNHADYGSVPNFSSLLAVTPGAAGADSSSLVVAFTGEIKRFQEEIQLASGKANTTKLQIREIQLRQVASLLGLELTGSTKDRLNVAELESRASSLASSRPLLALDLPIQNATTRTRLLDF